MPPYLIMKILLDQSNIEVKCLTVFSFKNVIYLFIYFLNWLSSQFVPLLGDELAVQTLCNICAQICYDL